MGLYDTVEIHESFDLPEFEGDHTEIEWQTKTFEPQMRRYEITEDGELLEEEYHTEMVPEEERRMYDEDIEGFEEDWHKGVGAMKWFTDGWNEKDFNEAIRIVGADEDEYWRYNLHFSDGELSEIELEERGERSE